MAERTPRPVCAVCGRRMVKKRDGSGYAHPHMTVRGWISHAALYYDRRDAAKAAQ